MNQFTWQLWAGAEFFIFIRGDISGLIIEEMISMNVFLKNAHANI